MKPPRRTKIVCTIGPATNSPEMLKALLDAGMDVARLNFSHGDTQGHLRVIRTLRDISRQMGRSVGILQDLGGPKIRLGRIPQGEVTIEAGQTVILSPEAMETQGAIPVQYPTLLEDVMIGERILLADGLMEMEVVEKSQSGLVCRVLVGGAISSHKGINLPSSRLSVPALTSKDKEDLKVGMEEGVDFVAISFVSHERDIMEARKFMDVSKDPPLLIAKIERAQAIERLDEIIKAVDGIMVARGDLGVETPLEEIPMVQKRIIFKALQTARPVITATQMLRSMINSPRPTRAEVTDVANAILDGTDALMLSEETAIGSYPIEAVRMLDRIARATEPSLRSRTFAEEMGAHSNGPVETAVGKAACLMAEDLRAKAIVAATTSGSTARQVSRFRPTVPILALTPNPSTYHRLSMSWGVLPLLVPPFGSVDDIFTLAQRKAMETGMAQGGDLIIVTGGVPVGEPGTTNMLKVVEVR